MQKKVLKRDFKREIGIGILSFVSLLIVFLGVFFCTYSVINHITIPILFTKISGVVLGVMVCYVGVRNYFRVMDLKEKMNAQV